MSNVKGFPVPRLLILVPVAGLVSLIIFFYLSSIPNNCPAPPPTPKLYINAADDKPVLLLWFWPEDFKFDLSECKNFNIDDCHLTDDRSLYNNADDVLIYHKSISWDLSNLPPSPRPPFQRWIWFHLESPTNTKKIPGLENLFNLTLSYRRDTDIIGRMLLTTRKKPAVEFIIPKKDKLVCWIVSNNAPSTGVGTRNQFFQEFRKHIEVNLFGKIYATYLHYNDYYPTIASCKFYLSFENSIHTDYITEKINGPLSVGTVPVVLGPPRRNYENFVPGDAFIHVNDFPDAKALAEYLLQLDKDDEAYRRFFNWRKHLSPSRHWSQPTKEFVVPICNACEHVARHREYKEKHDLYDWYFN